MWKNTIFNVGPLAHNAHHKGLQGRENESDADN